MAKRYTIKIAAIEVDESGKEVQEIYTVVLNYASTERIPLEIYVDQLIEGAEEDYHFDPVTDSNTFGIDNPEGEYNA